jgi:hypothetical protein
MTRIGNIFVGDKPNRSQIGVLTYDGPHNHAMIGFDLAAVLPLVRACTTERLHGCCIPLIEVDDPPYLHHELQVCGSRGKRIKCGWVYTESNEHGVPAYQVLIECRVVLKLWDRVWIHCHEEQGEKADGSQG